MNANFEEAPQLYDDAGHVREAEERLDAQARHACRSSVD